MNTKPNFGKGYTKEDFYPASRFKAEHVADGPITVTISHLGEEDFGGKDGIKPLLFFSDDARTFVVNATNFSMLAELFGPNSSTWGGLPN